MSALRASPCRRKGAAQTGDRTPVEAEVIPMIEQARTTTTEQVSTPIPVTAEDGTCLVAGLTWEIASGPETPVIRPNAPLVLRLPERRARLARGGRDIPTSSLLLAMGTALLRAHPETSGPWVFLVELHDRDAEPVFWLGFADLAAPGEGEATISPRPGAEQVFSEPDTAMAALGTHLATTEIAGIGVTWLPGEETDRGRILQHLAHIAPTLPLEDVDFETTGGDLPCFVAPRHVPARWLGGVTTAAALLLAAVFVILPKVEEAFRVPPPPPPEMTRVQIEQGAFATTCTKTLDAWWPRVVGWQLSSTGCALAGHLPDAPVLPDMAIPARPLQPMITWHHLTAEADRNTILATSAAERVIGTWPHDARMTDEGLTFWQVTFLPLVPVENTEADPAFDAEAAHARLATLWANAPGAVNRDGQRFIVRPGADTSPGDLFDRAARVPGIAPVSLLQGSVEAVGTTLVLATVTQRAVPVTMIGGETPSQEGQPQ